MRQRTIGNYLKVSGSIFNLSDITFHSQLYLILQGYRSITRTCRLLSGQHFKASHPQYQYIIYADFNKPVGVAGVLIHSRSGEPVDLVDRRLFMSSDTIPFKKRLENFEQKSQRTNAMHCASNRSTAENSASNEHSAASKQKKRKKIRLLKQR